MRGALRWTIACFAAGLLLGPVPASAQEAPTTNTPVPEAVGPRELQNFSLEGNVTREAEQPAERPAAPAVTSGRDEQPVASAQGSRLAPRARAEVAEAAPSTSRSTQPSRRGQPREDAAASLLRPSPPSNTGFATQPVPTPASAPAFAGRPLAASQTLPPERGFTFLPWLLAALAAAAGGLFLFWRNRSGPVLAGGPQAKLPEAPQAPSVRWLTPEPEPKPMPRVAPASAPTPAPSPAPRADTSPPKPQGIVSTGLRPWVEVNMRPLRCTVTEAEVTFEFELDLFNSGSAPARDILVEAVMVNAGENQDQDLAAFFSRPPGPGQRIDVIAPLSRTAFTTQVVVSRDHVRVVDMGGRQVFVPLLAFNAFYRRGTGEGQSSVTYLVGPAAKGEKLAPFRVDLGPRMFDALAARMLPLGVRK